MSGERLQSIPVWTKGNSKDSEITLFCLTAMGFYTMGLMAEG